jgi:tRNA(Arg) A34 adenosine deaminase TadA
MFDKKLIEDLAIVPNLSGLCSDNTAILLRGRELILQSAAATLSQDDPTAHAAVHILRMARRMKIRPEKLSDHTLLISGKPCPMCISHAWLHHLKDVYRIHNQEMVKMQYATEDFFEQII